MIVDNVPSEYGNATYSFDVFATGLVKANLFNQ